MPTQYTITAIQPNLFHVGMSNMGIQRLFQANVIWKLFLTSCLLHTSCQSATTATATTVVTAAAFTNPSFHNSFANSRRIARGRFDNRNWIIQSHVVNRTDINVNNNMMMMEEEEKTMTLLDEGLRGLRRDVTLPEKERKDIICEKQLDYVGAGTLGDIMSQEKSSNQLMRNDTNENKEEVVEREEEEGVIPTRTSSLTSIHKSSLTSIHNSEKKPNRPSTIQTESTGTTTTLERPTTTASRQPQPQSGLVTSTGGTLQHQFGSKIPFMTPLDRIALTANGNLQRIVSSFYDAPVHIHVVQCERRQRTSACSSNSRSTVDDEFQCQETKTEEQEQEQEQNDTAIWDRTVHLSVYGQVSPKCFFGFLLSWFWFNISLYSRK